MTDDSAQTPLNALVERVKAVRRWLVALALLRSAALALACVSLYVLLYAALDHYVHLGVVGRLVCLTTLVGGVGALLYYLLTALAGHISCRNAANHVERQFKWLAVLLPDTIGRPASCIGNNTLE